MNTSYKTMTRVSETEEQLRDDAPSAGQILQALLGLLKRRKSFVITLVVIIAVGFGIYGKYFDLTDAERAQKELATAVVAVSKLMIIPEGDEPVLATVTDAEALQKQQAFFTGAMNGDQLLLFPRNLKAVIYSPSRDKIVNAGPIEQQPQATAPQNNADLTQTNAESLRSSASGLRESATVSGTLTVEVRNGTGKGGLAAEIADNIRAAGFTVIALTDAKDKKYSKTIVVSRIKVESLAPLEATLLKGLATQIGAELIANLPDGEKNTEADVLIILGGK